MMPFDLNKFIIFKINCAYQEIINARFWGNFVHVLNG